MPQSWRAGDLQLTRKPETLSLRKLKEKAENVHVFHPDFGRVQGKQCIFFCCLTYWASYRHLSIINFIIPHIKMVSRDWLIDGYQTSMSTERSLCYTARLACTCVLLQCRKQYHRSFAPNWARNFFVLPAQLEAYLPNLGSEKLEIYQPNR